MKPSIGSIFWFVAALSIFAYYNSHLIGHKKQITYDNIIFNPKVMVLTPHPNNQSIFTATGTWTGDGVGYKNNSNRIICYQKDMICTVQSIEQIGENQVSSIDYPTFYSISKWDNDTIISSILDEVNCRKATITILTKLEKIFYSDEFIEPNNNQCKNADRKSYKWTLEDSLFWQKTKK